MEFDGPVGALNQTLGESMLNQSLYESTRDVFKSGGGKGYCKDVGRHSSKAVGVDDFEIKKVVGRGSFGKVYLVKKKDVPDKVFAMKVLYKDMVLKKKQAEHTKGSVCLVF
jgi:serine/threonine protein kinase